MPSSRPARTSSTSTSWTTTTSRISRSARSSAKRCASTASRRRSTCTSWSSPSIASFPDFAAAGATYISFHPEASEHVDRTLQLIREHGCKSGLVFNPATPLDWLEHVLDKVDLVLLMSVNPGFGGQQFIESTLPKIAAVRALIDRTRAADSARGRRRREGREHRAGSRRPAPTRSSRARRSSARPTTPPRSPRCGARLRQPVRRLPRPRPSHPKAVLLCSRPPKTASPEYRVMTWTVHKFGGTSVADASCIRLVAGIIGGQRRGNLAVVVSAMKGVTDDLLGLVDKAAQAAARRADA